MARLFLPTYSHHYCAKLCPQFRNEIQRRFFLRNHLFQIFFLPSRLADNREGRDEWRTGEGNSLICRRLSFVSLRSVVLGGSVSISKLSLHKNDDASATQLLNHGASFQFMCIFFIDQVSSATRFALSLASGRKETRALATFQPPVSVRVHCPDRRKYSGEHNVVSTCQQTVATLPCRRGFSIGPMDLWWFTRFSSSSVRVTS